MVVQSQNGTLDDQKKWDLVYISDSTGWGVAEKYAENIARETGKIVEVHDYSIGMLPALDVLKALQRDPGSTVRKELGTLQADIAEAEVIVFFGNPRGEASEEGVTGGMENCLGGSIPPNDCTSALYEPYVENLKSIYAEILALRGGKSTIIRAVDFANPLLSQHRRDNIETTCRACFEIFNARIREAAEAYNVPLVSVYDAFNGKKHNEDPVEKGYIGPDGMHASGKGQQVIADLLSNAGFEPIERKIT
jgi:hypothetical protein